MATTLAPASTAATTPMSASSSAQAVLAAFEGHRAALDAHYDKRDRLNQLSRDITSLSKKLIFLLHRLSTTPRASAVTTAEEHYSEASAKEAEVRGLFGEVGRLLRDGGEGPSETGPAPPAEGVQSGGDTSTAVTSDTDTGAVDVAAVTLDEPKQAAGNYWRYARQVSGGEQEYIEALSFLHYLLHPPSSTLGHSEALISLAEVQARMADPVSGEPWFPITPEEYILGLSDLSGELMRFCLNAIAKGMHDEAIAAAAFVRTMKAEFDPLLPLIPQLAKKQQVTAQSLAKVENAVYQLAIRRKEFEGRPEVLAEMVRRSLEAPVGGGGAGQESEGPTGGGDGDEVAAEGGGGGSGSRGGKRAAGGGGAGGRGGNNSKRGRANK